MSRPQYGILFLLKFSFLTFLLDNSVKFCPSRNPIPFLCKILIEVFRWSIYANFKHKHLLRNNPLTKIRTVLYSFEGSGMGFSLVGSFGSHVLLKECCHKIVKFQTLSEKERFSVKFVSKSKSCPGRASALLCKSELVDFEERTSPQEVRKEIEQCYELIHRLGRGVVYLGSARMGPDHLYYAEAHELSREIANLLDCTTWSGAGPGLMDAVTKGALQAGKPVGGLKIDREAGEWTASKFHPYLPSETYLSCKFFSARKHGLVDAAVRNNSSDRTAVVALPGGIGTLDEMFEILALIQLERIGSKLPVPFLVMNYDSFYGKLFDFLGDCENWGTLARNEVASLWKICDNNSEALSYLTEFYDIPSIDRHEIKFESTSGNRY
ncbi:uncharacterized protein LOC123213433 isoform X1 [Mangifera indica]|uniref:uncharacterized protein LOC123213433 isoform X1 n=1 Tax=Mangifera indica TaxID=29780 RepID=UPI001CF9F21C|nr:uncharacterized protein LOC123213433 isoform X1 [Mangifera indica]